MRTGGRDWPGALLDTLAAPLRPSAVLIPLLEKNDRLSVLLTERAEDLTHHAGQISFPGGAMEPGDRDLVETALREAEEEIGIVRRTVEIIGYLAPLPTVSGYAVTPIVGLLPENPKLKLDRREVAATFEVPLDFLLDRGNQQHSVREVNGFDVPVITFEYDRWRIWGATAAMIAELQSKLL